MTPVVRSWLLINLIKPGFPLWGEKSFSAELAVAFCIMLLNLFLVRVFVWKWPLVLLLLYGSFLGANRAGTINKHDRENLLGSGRYRSHLLL